MSYKNVSEGIYINKTRKSKECMLCHYWYFNHYETFIIINPQMLLKISHSLLSLLLLLLLFPIIIIIMIIMIIMIMIIIIINVFYEALVEMRLLIG